MGVYRAYGGPLGDRLAVLIGFIWVFRAYRVLLGFFVGFCLGCLGVGRVYNSGDWGFEKEGVVGQPRAAEEQRPGLGPRRVSDNFPAVKHTAPSFCDDLGCMGCQEYRNGRHLPTPAVAGSADDAAEAGACSERKKELR